jgi:dihydrolipoamide dehydrogenase
MYDVVVIGSGPGGYVCAIRAAQLGLKVACVEQYKTFGGTCLNVGCIPSKALLESSELLHKAQHEFAAHGIAVAPQVDLATMQGRKEKIVASLTRGVAGLFKKHGIDGIVGVGSLVGPGRVAVAAPDGSRTIETRNVVIATGSKAVSLPGIALDGERVFHSTDALALRAVPGRLAVIGAGVIGLELGSVWRRLGSQVTVFEYLDRVLPPADVEVSKAMQRALSKQGFTFRLGVAVRATERDGDVVTVRYDEGGTSKSEEFDAVLVAVGRRPNTDGLGAQGAGLKLDGRGRVDVDEHGATNLSGVYAIGDVVAGPMLAHKAEDEGVAVAERIAGLPGHVNYDVIPSVVYTSPEVAWVGRTEAEAAAAGFAVRTGRFPFQANGRAKALMATDGFVKLVVDARTDRVLGAHIVGPMAGELIAELAIAMEFGASTEDVARTCHAHPTLSEVVREAALDAGGRVIQI